VKISKTEYAVFVYYKLESKHLNLNLRFIGRTLKKYKDISQVELKNKTGRKHPGRTKANEINVEKIFFCFQKESEPFHIATRTQEWLTEVV
jgi:hypothetical protein